MSSKVYSRDQWFWQNFINLMCDIKFWKGNVNLRYIYKKTVFRNFERFLPFLTFFSSQKSSLSLLKDENFFSLNRSNGASKNPSFCTDFKNVHLTFVKSAPKKSFSQKTILPIENRFFGQNFFWVHFLLRSYVHFWNQYEKTDTVPHST